MTENWENPVSSNHAISPKRRKVFLGIHRPKVLEKENRPSRFSKVTFQSAKTIPWQVAPQQSLPPLHLGHAKYKKNHRMH
jgi:hypothetical protein